MVVAFEIEMLLRTCSPQLPGYSSGSKQGLEGVGEIGQIDDLAIGLWCLPHGTRVITWTGLWSDIS